MTHLDHHAHHGAAGRAPSSLNRLALSATDRVIYGNQFNEDDTEASVAFDLLRDFAERRYSLVGGEVRS